MAVQLKKSPVSTHSRPKAAGNSSAWAMFIPRSFNTQPPEGGWSDSKSSSLKVDLFQHTAARRRLGNLSRLRCRIGSFNTQPPEGGWPNLYLNVNSLCFVSTHSRPKAAGFKDLKCRSFGLSFQHTAARRRLVTPFRLNIRRGGCFNTQPPEGGWVDASVKAGNTVCFNTQPPEGGWTRWAIYGRHAVSFNTQPPEGGWSITMAVVDAGIVSTHSRPKAAGEFWENYSFRFWRFNTQPPEGGWCRP